ncbi:nucleotide sugar dehydrogenase [Carnobacterium maltaromaticum]|uniref:nucleotide sugar dehydrogenase n=1 Tax=Carnobacterium maltaromaticum TaxID=2751 RepID=UPI000705066A|nr:nucleotide sugar dehydrogenase [Carnobacterium maltaromaticum]KRN83968.1 hypothetical protein IV75_GL000672 [Carnobacterium maltaromaticum]MDT1943580.1 nucleotide sugar dehydrogenase [Carnobacterium maltaromaticum]MDT1998960.1 nucleotide sugar dehydrogenase [Carnobacterium maltaromaticum]TFJ24605.1 nucleotide sugar dehydrogenase [Carnobacterium maltaromaticum]TFJ30010.1 nucleotide sugar dehydrogenase [Carnobacterium maltaromaticum]
MRDQFITKINNRTATIGVIGLGYVGLPLALSFAEAGFYVTGFDKSEVKIALLKQGKSDILDISSDTVQMAFSTGHFQVSNQKESLKGLDCFIICVPTPLTDSYEPDISYIQEALDTIHSEWESQTLVILESTTYPGTSKELIHEPLIQQGYLADQDFMVAYSPERVDPGNKKFKIKNTPKVVGGTTENSLEISTLLYQSIVEQVVPVTSTEVAEMSKLLENTFRSINIAFINEMAILCEQMGIDIWETIQASETKPFGYMKFLPGPGIGGHCIPLDPMYLNWKAKKSNHSSRLIELAQEINREMPKHVASKAKEALLQHNKVLKGSKILLMGMAYKENSNDLRESPSLQIFDDLQKAGSMVEFCDPLTTYFIDKHGYKQESIELDYTLMETYDLVILLVNHDCFDRNKIANKSQLILDTKNSLNNQYPEKTIRLGDKSK